MPACAHRRGDVFIRAMHGEKHHPGKRAMLPERLCRLEAIELGHRDVQHHDIGLETQRQVHRLKTMSRSADDVEVGREQTADRFQHSRVIVCHQNARSRLPCVPRNRPGHLHGASG